MTELVVLQVLRTDALVAEVDHCAGVYAEVFRKSNVVLDGIRNIGVVKEMMR